MPARARQSSPCRRSDGGEPLRAVVLPDLVQRRAADRDHLHRDAVARGAVDEELEGRAPRLNRGSSKLPVLHGPHSAAGTRPASPSWGRRSKRRCAPSSGCTPSSRCRAEQPGPSLAAGAQRALAWFRSTLLPRATPAPRKLSCSRSPPSAPSRSGRRSTRRSGSGSSTAQRSRSGAWTVDAGRRR